MKSEVPGERVSFYKAWYFVVIDVSLEDWTLMCTASWGWHPHQPAPVVKKTKPHSMLTKDTPFTVLHDKMSALSWRPDSTAANESRRRWLQLSPEDPDRVVGETAKERNKKKSTFNLTSLKKQWEERPCQICCEPYKNDSENLSIKSDKSLSTRFDFKNLS